MDWHTYFMSIAFIVSMKSKDQSTKHGCVIVKDNRIISTGYNSFARGMPDEEMPQGRGNVEKYKWMIHSEQNAINFMPVVDHAIAYVTGKPCLACLQSLWNANITTIYMANLTGWTKDAEQEEDWNKFVRLSGIKVYKLEPQLNQLKEYIQNLEDKCTQRNKL